MEMSQCEPRELRELLAFMLAPLVVPLVVTLDLRLWEGGSIGFFIAVIATMVGYVGTLMIGLPLYLLLRNRNATAFLLAPVFGAVIGAVAARLVWSVFGLDRPSDSFGFGGLTGAAVGTVLWLIARPDLLRRGGGAEGSQ